MEQRGGNGVFFKSLKKTTTNKSINSFLHLGQISRSHGLRGEVFISLPFRDSDLPNRLLNKKIQIQKDENILDVEVLQIRWHKQGLIAQLEGIDSIEQVKTFVGAQVFAPKNLFISASGENMYLCEIEGFEIWDKSRSFIGIVSGFSSNGAQDLLQIQTNNKISNVFEVPFIEPLVTEVDFKAKKILTDLPFEWPGLDDKH